MRVVSPLILVTSCGNIASATTGSVSMSSLNAAPGSVAIRQGLRASTLAERGPRSMAGVFAEYLARSKVAEAHHFASERINGDTHLSRDDEKDLVALIEVIDDRLSLPITAEGATLLHVCKRLADSRPSIAMPAREALAFVPLDRIMRLARNETSRHSIAEPEIDFMLLGSWR